MRNLIAFFWILLSLFTSAQEVVSTGGDYYQQANGSLSFTIGEPVIETYYNGTILTQGFQQDFENILSIQELQAFMFFEVYPNPFSSEITIKYNPTLTAEYSIELKDAAGKEIYDENYFFSTSNFSHKIGVSSLTSGLYFLQLRQINTGETIILKLNKIN